MKVLVIGSGAREYAIVWKLAQSRGLTKLYCAPGNAGIAEYAECVDIKADNIEKLLDFALTNKIDMTVVGPEAPLVDGIVDLFESKGLRIFGPCQKAAMLEGSKVFAKNFMRRHGIPTARYGAYDNFEGAIAELQSFELPVVIKADGLAAGKGVIIAETRQEAVDAIQDIMGNRRFGAAGSSIVIEEFLEGKEVSVLAFVDGNIAVPMESAQDYKRALDHDMGLNTGGMGAISPAPHYTYDIEETVRTEIINRTVEALKIEGIDYKGVLYFGLMLTKSGPKVLEYNARFGDPETEVVLLRLQSDLLAIMNAVIDGSLADVDINWAKEKAVCVALTSGGYPEDYEIGKEIRGIEAAKELVLTFHAGTRLEQGRLLTAGGRVLVVSACAEDYYAARSRVYKAIEKISFEAMHYRRDIGENI